MCFTLSHTWPCLYCKDSGWYWGKIVDNLCTFISILMHNFVLMFLFRGLIKIFLIYNFKVTCFSYSGPYNGSFLSKRRSPVSPTCACSVLIGEFAEGSRWSVQ